MNTIFLITGETPKHVQTIGQWFANRVANVYPNPEAVGNAIPEMPVAVLVEGEVQGVIPALRKLTKAAIVHVHVGPDAIRKAQGSEQFYHLKSGKTVDPKNVALLMSLESMWREEKARSRGVASERRDPIKVP